MMKRLALLALAGVAAFLATLVAVNLPVFDPKVYALGFMLAVPTIGFGIDSLVTYRKAVRS